MTIMCQVNPKYMCRQKRTEFMECELMVEKISKKERKELTSKFKEMLKDLEEIVNSINPKYKLNRLSLRTVDKEIEEFEFKDSYGISEFYWYGVPSYVEWMIGVRIYDKKPMYEYSKTRQFYQNETHEFETKDGFIEFLKSIGLIE